MNELKNVLATVSRQTGEEVSDDHLFFIKDKVEELNKNMAFTGQQKYSKVESEAQDAFHKISEFVLKLIIEYVLGQLKEGIRK
jgi:hypothetical protein